MLLVFINIRSDDMCGCGHSSLIHVAILFHPFSSTGNVINDKCSCLLPDNADKLIFLLENNKTVDDCIF